MFKFPLKRHHNNHNDKKSASIRNNEGFIYIRCGHNNSNATTISKINNNNNYNKNSKYNVNSKDYIIPDIQNQGFNKNDAKSTVQSSWRPQLPLPKEVHLSNENIQCNHFHNLQPEDDDNDINRIQIVDSDMERFHLSNSNKKDSSHNGSQLSNGSSSNKKWSFGRLFRRKKEIESESSSEEDRKAGFVPVAKCNRSASNSMAAITSTPNKKTKSSKSASRGSKLITGNADYIHIRPANISNNSRNLGSSSVQHVENEFFLPVETVSAQEPFYQNNLVVQVLNTKPQQRLHHSQQHLTHVSQAPQQLLSRSALSLDRRSSRAKKIAYNGVTVCNATVAGSSSEEEIISLNSTTFSKYRSDESIHSGGQGHANGQSRRSRAARNERYYKRLSRDGEVSHGQLPVLYAQQPTQRWKTQPVPLSIYQAPKQQVATPQQLQPQVPSCSSQNSQYSRLRNTNSLQHMAPYVQWGQMQQQQQHRKLQNCVSDTKRSISYDNHIHLQNINGRLQNKPLPPPPPPRDPLRKVNVSCHLQDGSSADLRPLSYAFDQTGVPLLPPTGLNARCVSDDKIWAQQPHYQSIHSLNITPNQGSQQITAPSNRRFISRAERDAQPGKKSLPNGLDFHYVADATPRSRKPIHLLEPDTFENDSNEPSSNGMLRTTKSGLPTSPAKGKVTEFWKRLEGFAQNTNTPIPAPRGRDIQRSCRNEGSTKPRSISSSRVADLRSHAAPMYSEVYKRKNKPPPLSTATSPVAGGTDEVDGVIFGSLHIKPSQDSGTNFVEVRSKDDNKSQSMPNHYHRHSGDTSNTSNKYEEYVNERREQHHNPLFDAPQPPQRKPFIPQLSFPRKKPANLEEAINELEAIYRSLGLTEETENKERIPTPNNFEKYAVAHADEYEDEDSPAGEPDPVRDDVAYRNIKLANLQHKTAERQPPFGIPLGPIVPAAQTDYLHVSPQGKYYESKAPDVIKDDLAVRALRKDPVENKDKFLYPSSSLIRKNRAMRTQSANIYALIQRDAAKPSGGDFNSYLELTKSIDRSGSMSDIHKNDSASDIPTTLKLLQSLREQDRVQDQHQVKKAHIPFRHPSQGGAISQLPEKLCAASHEDEKPSKPTPMPRKSLTPEPQNTDTHKMEEALNKIAQDAQESSIKLTQELKELRKEALITASRPRKGNCEEERLVKELQEIEKVSQAAKKCGEMLLDTLPDHGETKKDITAKPRKLHKEDKLIKAIDQVSEAANKVCEKILKDIVTTEPPVVVHEAVRVIHKPTDSKTPKVENLVMPTLIKKLDPVNPTNTEAIARRCMRQLSDLADNHDYDNINQPDIAVATSCNMQQITKDETSNDLKNSNITETRKPSHKPKQQQIEEIDQIMKECEHQAKQHQNVQIKEIPVVVAQQQQNMKAPGSTTTASSFSSSSDCLAKSSSPSGSRRFSSSVTSFNPYSSSDYIKSTSSDFHAPSTDRIKTFSTTSYDVQSTTSATPNLTTISTFSCSPSPPPLNLTPISNCSATIASNTQRGRSSSPSQYNSSEELAMIFGIEERSKAKKIQNNSGKSDVIPNATTPELLLAQEKLKTNAASPSECTAYPDNCQCCVQTNGCLLFLNPSSYSHNTNNNASSSPISSASIDNEGLKEKTCDDNVKYSANFNKIYSSKLSIFVDKMEQSLSPPTLTKCDSLSSLEETCSNPDSGNVSLADFPLAQQNLNVSVHLNSNYNTRLKLRNCFKTEVTLDDQKQKAKVKLDASEVEEIVDFPRLPTAEELENSLKERFVIEENVKKTKEVLGEQNALREKFALAKEDHELIGEKIIWARDEIMAEVKATREKQKADEIVCLAEKIQTEEKEESLEGNCTSFKLDANETLTLVEKEATSPMRKQSIVIETPHLEMNIMEERIHYEFTVGREDSFEQAEDSIQALETRKEENRLQTENDLRLSVWQPVINDEVPSTSSKATSSTVVNVLGEQRQAVNSLTILEHLVVACTLGVINTDDLVALCLIIIGIILVIAIALF